MSTGLPPTPPVSLEEVSVSVDVTSDVLALQEQTPSQTPSIEPAADVDQTTKPKKTSGKRKQLSHLEQLKLDALWTLGYYNEETRLEENFNMETLKSIHKRTSRSTNVINDNASTQGPLYRISEGPVTRRTSKKPSSKNVTKQTRKRVHVKRNPSQDSEYVKVSDPNVKTFGQFKKAWGADNKRPSSLLDALKADAEWFCSMGRGDDEVVDELGDRRKLRRVHKTFFQEQAEDEQRLIQERQERKAKEHEQMLREREINLKRLEEKRREEQRRLKAVSAQLKASRAKNLKESKKAEKVEDEKIKKKAVRKAAPAVSKTPVEDLFGCKNEYYPFILHIVVNNEQTPIDAKKFFTDEVLNGEVSGVTEFQDLITASSLLESRAEHYHDFPGLEGEDRKRLRIKSCIFPDFEEEYLSRGSLNHGELDTFFEVGRIMELCTISYIPPQYQLQVFNKDAPHECISGRYGTALKQKEIKWDKVFAEISNYNQLIQDIHSKNEFLPYLQSKTEFPKLAIHEILNQVYARSVLPESQKLKQYKGFSAEVYGELLPSFVSKLLVQTRLNSDSIFLDLGSGVGNVVLQAALEYGAESYGCEMMDNCADIAAKQLFEFEARSRIYGIRPGKVGLIHSDFTKSDQVAEVLPKADVILITNFLFDDELNAKVLEMLRVVKVGARIISLKPVVPDSYTWEEDENQYISKLKVQRFEFGQDSVSWSGSTGFYYVSEVTDSIQPCYKTMRNTRLTKMKNDVYTNIKTKKIPYSANKFYEVIASSHANVPGTTFSQSSSRPLDDQFVSTAEIKFERSRSTTGRSRSKSPQRKTKKETQKITELKNTDETADSSLEGTVETATEAPTLDINSIPKLEAIVTDATIVENEEKV
ncbi:hypothetical protein WICPIJ_007832 [Wickerhamomyces pijperi]|uniref:Histone-lysine N-methyltransferase, H3 lysine-79 specific n=1 Tax=Wickerhamomyces pijperi TaxID=599730 RepID=A0A9P8PZ17_WICPI|nr:hypothetical protein WICPIJ_007832 [Wickerhamomyces pijperi]